MFEIKKKYFRGGNIHKMIWFEKDKIHRQGLPAYVVFHINGMLHTHAWYHQGKPHRLSGPAAMYYDDNAKLVKTDWFINGNIIDPPSECWPLTHEQQIELKLYYG